MSIATAITAAQGKVADCYTAISNKGGTLPATQNLSNMPTAINSIPSGGGGNSKYGCTIDNFFPDNGTTAPASNFYNIDIVLPNTITTVAGRAFTHKFYYLSSNGPKSFTAPSVTNIDSRAFEYCFYQSSATTFVSFPVLKTISSVRPFDNAFSASGVTDVSFPELEEVSGNSVFYSAFYGNRLNSVSFPKLKTVSGVESFLYAFPGNNPTTGSYLTSVEFPLLNSITGSGAFSYSFGSRYNLSSLSFPSLKTTSFTGSTTQFSGMFNANTGSTATGGCTVHFPSNLSSTISGLTGYPTFGGSSSYINLAFDLPATS